MKKINYKMLSLTFLVTLLTTLVPACFQGIQAYDAEKAELMLGFPFDFYTVRYALDGNFAIHFNIAGFAVNIIVTYFLIKLGNWLIHKLWSRRRRV